MWAIYWKFLLGYGYFPWFVFPLLYGASTALLRHSLWIHDLGHNHSLASIQYSRPSNQRTLLQTKICLKCQKWEHFLPPFRHCPRPLYRQLQQLLCTSASAVPHPPPPVPPFLLAQNLSSKWIAPTNNIPEEVGH